jgi:hypothetical protein
MHPLLLACYFLSLSLGDVVVHPKIGIAPRDFSKPPHHQLCISHRPHMLITAILATLLAFSGGMVVVIPSIALVLRKGKVLVVIDLVSGLVCASR